MLLSKGKIDCDPIELGYDKGREEVLIRHFERMIEKKEIQCASYCVSRKGKIILQGAVGPRSFEEGCQDGVLPDSICPVASITKVFCAVALMQLIENGLARLDTPVGEILPQFNTPPYNKITLFQLLSHTSGLEPDENTYEDKYRVSPWKHIEDDSKGCENLKEFDWISSALKIGLRKEPGTEWQYCSFGFVILGAVIEKLSGEFASDYIQKHILDPLGMKDSGFNVPKDKIGRMFCRNEEEKEIGEEVLSGALSENIDAGTIWEYIPPMGGGMLSTAPDLVRFGNMMLNKGRLDGVRILGRKTVEKMTTNQLHNIPDNCWESCEKDRRYGVGFDMRTGLAYHYSDNTFMHEGAGACCLVIDPVEEMVASWFVPFIGDNWYAHGLYNVTNIIWSGLI